VAISSGYHRRSVDARGCLLWSSDDSRERDERVD
jgi:hypothetical protein